MLHPLSILYLTFLLTQLYALTLHFPRPRAGLVHPRSFQLLKLCTGVAALASWQPVLNLSPTAPLAATLPPSLCLLASEALFAWTAHAARPGKLALIYGRVTPRYVVADGPFAYVRHPTYASYWTGWLGVLAAAVVGARWPGYVLRAWLGPRVRAVVLATCLVELGWCYWAAAYLEEVQFLEGVRIVPGERVSDEVRRAYAAYERKVPDRWVPHISRHHQSARKV